MAKKAKNLWLQLVALFAVVRGYNIAVLVAAMYLTAYSIFAKDISLIHFLEEWKIHLMVLAAAFTVSGGYIINNYYDLDRDAVSRPLFTFIGRYISQNFKLNVYLVMNLIATILAFSASWRMALFFVVYQAMVWLYSHKLNRIIFINNLFSTLLALFPFLALLLYYNNYSWVILSHGAFLGLLVLSLDIAKDFISYRADLIYDYRTLPVNLGKKNTKIIIFILLILSELLAVYFLFYPEVGMMKWYFRFTVFAIACLSIFLFFMKESWQYHIFHGGLKLLLGSGVISIAWIKINPMQLQHFF